MMCQSCGVEAPTKYVEFYQNIGLLILRLHQSVTGNLCKSCIHKYFWQYSAINMIFGWWGLISFFCTFFFLVNNTFRYLACLGMPAVPAGVQAGGAHIGSRELEPFIDEIFDRLQHDEKLERVAEEIAEQAGVTPGQVVLYVLQVLKAMKEREE